MTHHDTLYSPRLWFSIIELTNCSCNCVSCCSNMSDTLPSCPLSLHSAVSACGLVAPLAVSLPPSALDAGASFTASDGPPWSLDIESMEIDRVCLGEKRKVGSAVGEEF